jgi:hypothetical protein
MVNSWLNCSLDRNCGQFGAHEQGHDAADEEENETGDHVHDADQLVIGGGHQLVDQVALGTEPGGERAAGLKLSHSSRFGSHGITQTNHRVSADCAWNPSLRYPGENTLTPTLLAVRPVRSVSVEER